MRTLIAVGVGYVLGSRAGRERYAQIVEAAQWGALRLQQRAGGARDKVGDEDEFGPVHGDSGPDEVPE